MVCRQVKWAVSPRIDQHAATSAPGQKRRFRDVRSESGLPPTAERSRQRSELTLRAMNRRDCQDWNVAESRARPPAGRRLKWQVPQPEDDTQG